MNPFMNHALEVKNANKYYGDLQALNNLNLTVKKGEFFGLLGPNGAGKSTLIKSIVGLNKLSSGQIKVSDFDVQKDYQKSRQLIGYAPQEMNMDRFFSIRRVLEFQAGYFGFDRKYQKQRAQELLELLKLQEKANKQYYKLSGGMQKRMLVAKSLITNPKLLILDEPTAGVDVEQRHELWEILRKLKASGTTIILTTHYIDEAETLCERVGIINHGKICEIDSPLGFIQKYCEPTVILKFNKAILPQQLSQNLNLKIACDNNKVIASGDRSGIMIEKILHQILKNPDYAIQDIEVKTGTLEDVFLKVTGDEFA